MKKNINFIALDEVTDPRNIGSIIRTAAAFNIDGLIVKDRSFPSKSKALHKSASGATEHLNIFKVSNINSTLIYLKKKNFWVSAFESHGKKDFTKHNWFGKNILLFGSEGFGLKKNTSKSILRSKLVLIKILQFKYQIPFQGLSPQISF